MHKKISFENTRLDVDFYKSFYNIEGDKQTIRDHYSTIGVSKKLIPNLDCLAKILSIVLDFELDVFGTNQGLNLGGGLLCDNHVAKFTSGDLVHFMNIFYGDIVSNIVLPSGQVNFNVIRLINATEVMNYETKWTKLVQELGSKFKFDEEFYLFFYKDIKQPTNPLFDWLSDGIFLGRHPNMNSYTSNDNCLSQLTSLLKNVDLNFIVKTYLAQIKQTNLISEEYMKKLSEVELPVYIFFNICKKKRLFWSENEKNEYIEKHSKKFADTIKFLKEMNHYEIDELEKITADIFKSHKTQVKSIEQVKSSKINYELSNYKSLIKKIISSDYIKTFSKINKLDSSNQVEILDQLLSTLLENVFHLSSNLNIMELKEFVLSFFYNSMLSTKNEDKEVYMENIKKLSIEFLNKFYTGKKLNVTLDSLDKDLDLLIKNKKFIKSTRIMTKLLLLLL